MPWMPKRVKFRKAQRRVLYGKGNATRGNTVAYGEYGLQTLERGLLTAQQIEAGRIAATHFLHREGKVFIRVFPDKPATSKPLETRMGKGKGEPETWVAPVKAGAILFELGGVGPLEAKQALARVAQKLPVSCRMVSRRHGL